MNLARILYPVRVLGPGDRIGIWVCGCRRGCRGCSNPELWNRRDEYEISVEDAASLIKRIAAHGPVDGFTVSGGEPMDQAAELAGLLGEIASVSDDIFIYTGYRIEELRAREDPATDRVLELAAVLADGPYVEELNDGTVLRGSSNQRLIVLNEKYGEKYERCLRGTHNRIQNFTTSDGVVSVGIHRATFQPPGAK